MTRFVPMIKCFRLAFNTTNFSHLTAHEFHLDGLQIECELSLDGGHKKSELGLCYIWIGPQNKPSFLHQFDSRYSKTNSHKTSLIKDLILLTKIRKILLLLPLISPFYSPLSSLQLLYLVCPPWIFISFCGSSLNCSPKYDG